VTFVLVVEDEDSFSDALSYMLRKEGFEVAVCPTGPDALAALTARGVTRCCSTSCSRGHGASWRRSAGACANGRNVPVIMPTARDTEVDRPVGLGLGANDYVTKPLSWRELLTRIQAVLRR